MKMKNLKLLTLITLSIPLLAACGASTLTYRISPEIRSTENIKSHVTLVAVDVKDLRQNLTQSKSEDEFYAKGPEKEAKLLKQAVLSQLKATGYKIISDPLLADLSIVFEIESLNAKVKTSLFKAKIDSVSHIRVKASKKGNKLEKLYKSGRSQEVAIPVNNNDVTGLINQTLTAQLSAIFSDSELLDLAKKSPKETTEVFVIDGVN